jgi:hypothetical protein
MQILSPYLRKDWKLSTLNIIRLESFYVKTILNPPVPPSEH